MSLSYRNQSIHERIKSCFFKQQQPSTFKCYLEYKTEFEDEDKTKLGGIDKSEFEDEDKTELEDEDKTEYEDEDKTEFDDESAEIDDPRRKRKCKSSKRQYQHLVFNSLQLKSENVNQFLCAHQ